MGGRSYLPPILVYGFAPAMPAYPFSLGSASAYCIFLAYVIEAEMVVVECPSPGTEPIRSRSFLQKY